MITTLIDNVADMLLQNQGSAKRPILGGSPRPRKSPRTQGGNPCSVRIVFST